VALASRVRRVDGQGGPRRPTRSLVRSTTLAQRTVSGASTAQPHHSGVCISMWISPSIEA
jgi:hypothetical protein